MRFNINYAMGGHTSLNIHVYDSPEKASEAAAMLFAAQVLQKPDSVLGFATGSTPIPTYKKLAAWHQAGLLDFSQAISFNLDEYVGLAKDHPCSYHVFMEENLFRHINLKASYLPDGSAKDLEAECKRYDAAIEKAGGIDLQFLGVGTNGHIGFNEPADTFVYGTQIVKLTDSTIASNRRFFNSADEVPREAIALGIGGIMQAKRVVFVAFGSGKVPAVTAMVKGDIKPQLPASILRLHQNAMVILDKEAAAGL